MSVSFVTKEKGREQLSLVWDPVRALYSAAKGGSDYGRIDVAGESVDFTVSGDVVPAFEASIVATEDFDVVGSEPTRGMSRHLSVARNGDLTLAWSNTTNPFMTLTLQGTMNYVACRFPPGATSGVVPAALFEQIVSEAAEDLAECPGSTCLKGSLSGTRETHVRVGDFDIKVAYSTWKLLTLDLPPRP